MASSWKVRCLRPGKKLVADTDIMGPLATILCRLRAGTVGLKRLCDKLHQTYKNSGESIFQLYRTRDREPEPLGGSDASLFEIGKNAFELPVTFTVKRLESWIRIHLNCGYLGATEERDKLNLPLISGFPCTVNHLEKRNTDGT